MPCTICEHPQRHQIEAALHAGTSQRQIAAQFGVGKSTLGRHLPHVAWPAPAPSPPAGEPTVAQCEAHLAQLHTRLARCQADLASVQAPLEAAQSAYRLAVLQDHAGRTGQARHRVQQLEAQIRELTDLETFLREGMQEATYARAQAQDRTQQARRAHWSRVAQVVSDPLERWVARLKAHPGGPPPAPPVLAAHDQWTVSARRTQVSRQLEARYPFVEGASTPLLPPPDGGAAAVEVWARRPFGYGGRTVAEGEIFELGGHANDDALVRFDYCRHLSANDTPVCHPETGRRFIAAGWLEKFARRLAPPEEVTDG